MGELKNICYLYTRKHIFYIYEDRETDSPRCGGVCRALPKPRKLRGWATYEGDEFAFRPCEEGEPTQLNVRTTTGGKVFNTTSAKKPLQVGHLSWNMPGIGLTDAWR